MKFFVEYVEERIWEIVANYFFKPTEIIDNVVVLEKKKSLWTQIKTLNYCNFYQILLDKKLNYFYYN